MTFDNWVAVATIVAAVAGCIFALGKWAHRRETASTRITKLEEWRNRLPEELDKVYARKDMMEVRLHNIDRVTADTNDKVSGLDDKMSNLLVVLAQRGDIERRRA